ncbi:MAG: hypothetical protein JXB05_07780 [Myxococcaceae bacterium]|nr:hypothetical protein [Myxococcaceae bacterium]
MRQSLLLCLVLSAGCAWDAGEGFAVLEPSVSAAYSPLPDRDAGGGYQQLASNFQVRLTTARMRLEYIELLGRTGGGGPTSFDPANPPPGYTLCHNGHCDREDGALVSYEEVEAELSGGASSASTVATLSVGDMDLLAPETFTPGCKPDCELPRTTLSNGRWAVTALRLEGTVRDALASPRFTGERPFRLELTPAGAQAEPVLELTGALDIPSDREHAPRVLLGLRLDVTPRVFDAVPWENTTPGTDGTVDLGHADNAEVRKVLLGELKELSPVVEVEREDR